VPSSSARRASPNGTTRWRPRRYGWTPWLVLLVALALTTTATVLIWWGARGREQVRFANAVQSAEDRVTGRLDIYITTLRGGAALFAGSDTVDEDEFSAYFARLDVQRRYPGIQGIGWSRRVASGLPGPADERYSIEYLEPPDPRNLAAMGYDMYSEPTRRAAMIRARDLGEPAMTRRVRLVQEIFGPEQAGFLIYVPVYAGPEIPATVEQRRSDLLGFVYAPFRADDLFAGIFGSEQYPRVSFSVYDGERADSAAVLHRSERAPDHTPRRVAETTVGIAGHVWTLVYESQPEFEAGSARGLVPLVLLSGLLASAWLFGMARGQARARAEAEQANQAKSAFLATMSHELRTPLNAIGGYIDLMQLGIPDPVTEKQRDYLERIQRAQKHLLGLINDVLNFVRLDAGRVVTAAVPVPVEEVVDDAETMIETAAAARRLSFVRRGGPQVSLLGDAEKVRQVLVNLLSNAVKFTEPGGTVETRWFVNDGHVAIQVADTGIGIEPERLDSIFDAFVQVDADLTRARQGTGLGLAISRSLAEAMGGRLEAESTPGVGSTFTLYLPLADPDEDATRAETA
jgi:signal transduction histidine kinase